MRGHGRPVVTYCRTSLRRCRSVDWPKFRRTSVHRLVKFFRPTSLCRWVRDFIEHRSVSGGIVLSNIALSMGPEYLRTSPCGWEHIPSNIVLSTAVLSTATLSVARASNIALSDVASSMGQSIVRHLFVDGQRLVENRSVQSLVRHLFMMGQDFVGRRATSEGIVCRTSSC